MATENMRKKLTEVGVDLNSSESEQITHLWNLYIKTQADLNASLTSIDQLRTQQTTEMKEVEQYVEHIRYLSDEREALTLEFETENEQLKGQVESLKAEVNGQQFNKETESMLLQQGLSDIARSNASEQVAYLLVERARLLDELEAEQGRSVEREQANHALTQRLEELQQELEEEKEDFEEDLEEEREKTKKLKESLKTAHEEEMTSVTAENERLQGLLNTATSKVGVAGGEGSTLSSVFICSGTDKEQVQSEKQDESARTNDAMSSDVDELKRELSELKTENEALRTKISELNEELETEKLETEDKVEERDKTIQKLRDEIERQHKYIAELQLVTKRSTSDKKSLEIQLNFAEQQLEDLQASEQQLRAANKKLQSEAGGRQEKCDRELSDIEEEKSKLSEELMSLKEKLRQKDRQILILEGRVSSSPRSSSLERQTSCEAKVTEIEEKMKLQQSEEKPKAHLEDFKHRLQTVVQGKEELRRQLEQQEKQISELKNELKEKSARQRMMEKATEEMESINEELSEKLSRTKEQFSKCKQDLEEEQYKSEEREMEFEGRLQQMQAETDALRRELNAAEMKTKDEATRPETPDNQEQMLGEKMEAITRQWETEKANWSRKLEQSSGEIKMLKDTLSQKELEMSRFKEDAAMLRTKKMEIEREMVSLKQEHFLEKEELEDEIEKMREQYLLEKAELEKELETMQQQSMTAKADVESELKALKQHDSEQKTRTKEATEDESNAQIRRLEDEIKTLRGERESELVNWTKKLAERTDELKRVKQEVTDKTQELSELQEECVTLRANGERLKLELERAKDQEQRSSNTSRQLSFQNNELQSSVRRLEESMRSLESAKTLLQKKCQEPVATEDMKQRLEPNVVVVKALEKRAEVAEKQWESLSTELFKAQSKADQLQQDLSSLKSKLHSRDSEIVRLHKQLERETTKCCRANEVLLRLEQQMVTVKEKEKMVQSKNSELQHRLIDLEGKLEATLSGQRATSDQLSPPIQKTEEGDKDSVKGDTSDQQVETLQQKLADLQAKYDAQLQKYTERKIRTKVKLQRAREVFDSEKSRLRSQLESSQHGFTTVKKQYAEVEVWQRHLQDGNIKLLAEKGKLLAQISELEDRQASHDRQLSIMRVRVHYLEDENRNLQERILFVMKQKQTLARLLEDYHTDRDTKDVADEDLNTEMASVMLHRVHLSNTSSGVDSMDQSSLHIDTGLGPYIPLMSPTLDSPYSGHMTSHTANGLPDKQSGRYGIDLTLDY
ncbi:hypothetical protein NP493_11g10033 [Ridgeia piscesae]|uniref:Uncharacterized protein n=1 Tax=Ridgeia piscesae TaxID=27915 RepID=A0AAD9ULG4_RIDPI|nr:hypothetical protein NP493_11g10033 [Ridgeia piscesae]